MATYIARRLVQAIPILLGITIIMFILAKLLPGDPFTQLLNPQIKSADIARMKQAAGLTAPLPVQYWNWLMALLKGDLGRSITFNQPVIDVIKDRLGPTVTLQTMTLIFTLIISIPLGVILAVRQYSTLDYVVTILTFAGISMPTFFLGLLAIKYVALTWKLLPPMGVITPGLQLAFPWNYLDVLKHLLLPALVLTVTSAASIIRYVRASMLEVVRQDFIRTARAKGLHENRVLYAHALRNALIPVITILGLSLPGLFSGGIITEQVFSIPGVGRALYQAIIARDYNVMMGITTFLAVLTVLGNLLADVAYAWVDPRIRYD
ncbi:MAG: ABC transporter permease [Clostridiales bacterium]|nr:ABC transporter permease [Clostridiales bacterium]